MQTSSIKGYIEILASSKVSSSGFSVNGAYAKKSWVIITAGISSSKRIPSSPIILRRSNAVAVGWVIPVRWTMPAQLPTVSLATAQSFQWYWTSYESLGALHDLYELRSGFLRSITAKFYGQYKDEGLSVRCGHCLLFRIRCARPVPKRAVTFLFLFLLLYIPNLLFSSIGIQCVPSLSLR